jgi:hypothetical protein
MTRRTEHPERRTEKHRSLSDQDTQNIEKENQEYLGMIEEKKNIYLYHRYQDFLSQYSCGLRANSKRCMVYTFAPVKMSEYRTPF